MSRLYIRVMTGFYSHRKTMRLATKIGTDAFWIPPRLWAYCAENQPDGDLSGYQPEELAMLVGYNKDASSMLVALKDCGFIDSNNYIHGWHEHNGYHQKFSERARAAAAARWGKEKTPHTPQKKDSGKRKEESGDKHCLEHACSINGSTSVKISVETNARILLHLLNEQSGRQFRELDSSLSPIIARLSEPGVTLEGCKTMLARQVKMWKGTDMGEYLRPETLFGKTKFNSYYAGKDQPIPDAKQQHSKTTSLNPAADRRNAGTCGNGTDWGAVARRNAEREEQARLAKEAAWNANETPPA